MLTNTPPFNRGRASLGLTMYPEPKSQITLPQESTFIILLLNGESKLSLSTITNWSVEDILLFVDVMVPVKISGYVSVDNMQLRERNSDPDDPDEGESVMWQSDGTGSGDDGDIMFKITAGGSTKTTTLIDFSAI